MGWIKQQTRTSEDIFKEIIRERPTWNGNKGDSSSPYKYWTDYLRDNFDVTLGQCSRICDLLKTYYHIDKFYFKPRERSMASSTLT